jgi:TPR repeat protein
MYDLGKGVARDAVQAVSWYRKAADGGNASAMLNLGTMYECGSGVAKDLVAAKTWYLNAMKADEPAGMRAAIRLDQAARHAAMPGLRDGSTAVAGPCKP